MLADERNTTMFWTASAIQIMAVYILVTMTWRVLADPRGC